MDSCLDVIVEGHWAELSLLGAEEGDGRFMWNARRLGSGPLDGPDKSRLRFRGWALNVLSVVPGAGAGRLSGSIALGPVGVSGEMASARKRVIGDGA